MITEVSIPPYVYEDHSAELSLQQGDVLRVDGQFSQYFSEFYPAIQPVNSNEYVMVLTQSCDLVRDKKRKPKLSHINVCLIRRLSLFLTQLINDEIKPTTIKDKKILTRDALDQLKDSFSKLFNNNDQKTLFFLPKTIPFEEDMVAVLPLSFSFQTNHYDLLIENRILGIKTEFQAKVGYIIGQLYNRIATPDLHDFGWDDKKIRSYINQLLDHLNLQQVPDKDYLEYIKANVNENIGVNELIQEYGALRVSKSLKPMLKNIKTHLIRLFEDEQRIHTLLASANDKRAISNKINQLLEDAISGD